MSFYVYSPLTESACREVITRAVLLAKVESSGGDLLVSQGRNKIRLTLEECGPPNVQKPFGGIRTKVSLNSHEPPESEKPLQKSMMEERRIAEIVRDIITALRPKEICSGYGANVPLESLNEDVAV